MQITSEVPATTMSIDPARTIDWSQLAHVSGQAAGALARAVGAACAMSGFAPPLPDREQHRRPRG